MPCKQKKLSLIPSAQRKAKTTKKDIVVYACDPSPGEAKTGGTLEPSAHQSIHVGKFQASERAISKNHGGLLLRSRISKVDFSGLYRYKHLHPHRVLHTHKHVHVCTHTETRCLWDSSPGVVKGGRKA